MFTHHGVRLEEKCDETAKQHLVRPVFQVRVKVLPDVVVKTYKCGVGSRITQGHRFGRE